MDLTKASITQLLNNDGFLCECGKKHFALVKDVIIESGALKALPDLVKKYGGTKVFLLCDTHTYEAAGEAAEKILDEAGIAHSKYCFKKEHLEPDEFSVGSAVMHYDHSCDLIVGVGGGVINDIGKILARTSRRPYIIVGTAPSMDGYASATSSMARDGLKVSLDSMCPLAVIGDLDILCNAPMKMLQAGVGDMIAKYISICEWRIAQLLIGEYYCENVAGLVRTALKKVVDGAEGLMRRDKDSVKSVMEGMMIAGIGMNYAGMSRPASGMEHYFSHVWDMRGLEFNTPVDLHGIQCGIATLLSLKVYDQLKQLTPDKEKALNYVKNFSFADWSDSLRKLLNSAAETMIEAEAGAGKYDAAKHAARLEKILADWDEILTIMKEELPDAKTVEALMDLIGAPKSVEEIGIDPACLKDCFKATKDIRDKYVASRLAWDLGVIDEIAQKVF